MAAVREAKKRSILGVNFIMPPPTIHGILSIPSVQNSVLANLNRRDWRDAIAAGIGNMRVSGRVLRKYLGARCHEPNCHRGPHTNEKVKYCDMPLPNGHGLLCHNVCWLCNNALQYHLDYLPGRLKPRTTIQCKRCSQRQRSFHPTPYFEACDCVQHVHSGWKCRACSDDLAARRLQIGDRRYAQLLKCHKRTVKRSKVNKKKVTYGGRERERPACATCGGTAWTVPAFHRRPNELVSDPKATFTCLCCEGVMIYPVGDKGRPL